MDGWFGIQPRGKYTNIFLINNKEIFEISEVENVVIDWAKERMCSKLGKVKQRVWGNNYPMCIHAKKVKLVFDIKYKHLIEKYIQKNLKEKFLYNTILKILLRDCEIEYIL